MPYAYTADNPLNGTDPSGLLFGVCDTGPANCLGSAGNALGGVSQAVFQQTGNVLGTAGQFAWQHGGRDLARTTLQALYNFDNTSFVDEVALNTVNFAQSVVNTPAALQNEWTVAQWVANHPNEALQNADTRIKQDFGVALAEGQYVWNHPNDTYNSTQQALGAAYYYYTHCADLGKVAADVLTGVTFTVATAYVTKPLFGDLAAACGCFPGDTMVDTPKGERAIDTLKVGDQVLAENPTTGKVEAEPIQAVIDDGIKPLMTVAMSDGSSLKVTTNHPFYVDASAVRAQAGWVQAGDLRLGDRVRTADGHDITIAGLRYHVGYAHVYTLTVIHDHDFFVGAARVLAHNASCNIPVSWGSNLATKLRSHWQDLRQFGGLTGKYKDAGSAAAAQRLITDIVNVQHDELRFGRWNEPISQALFFRRGDLIVVLKTNGEFVTVLNTRHAGETLRYYLNAEVVP